ncbi:mitochondrial glycine transporter [Trichomonascus vanleenenianus]|uniref:Hem25p n=1 Tax=Trichomonascus vanleenenianus TaxID=2268995 RepID=UPI003ECA0506
MTLAVASTEPKASPVSATSGAKAPDLPTPDAIGKAAIKTKTHLSAGFISGMTSAVLLQPLDLLKTRVQQSKSSTLSSSLKELTNVAALWRGTVPSALRTSVGSALYFTTLTATRTQIAKITAASHGRDARASSDLPKLSMQANLLSGAIVRGIVGFMTMPITVIKVRYESTMFQYRSIMEAGRDIFRSYGLKGFFSGFAVTFGRDAPYAGLYVLFYEKNKELMCKMVSPKKQMESSTAALVNSSSAMISATMATTLTGPFDTIKTRVQIDPQKYSSFWTSAKLIVGEGGVKELFDGLSLRLARKAMSAGIAWCIYEELVRRI